MNTTASSDTIMHMYDWDHRTIAWLGLEGAIKPIQSDALLWAELPATSSGCPSNPALSAFSDKAPTALWAAVPVPHPF